MKALSIRQPWAHAILHLGKRVENRDWAGCAYRGPILLHASKSLVLRDFDEEIESILDIVKPEPGPARSKMLDGLAVLTPRSTPKSHPARGCTEVLWRPAPTLPLGGIVGRARIVDVVTASTIDAARGSLPRSTYDATRSPWYGGGFAVVLADVEPLPFIPWKGSLGFFDVPAELIAEVTSHRIRRVDSC